RGMIEIGYGIVPEMQGRGLGKELLLAAWKWVLEYPNVKILRYTVGESNSVSLHIIQSLGFDFVGQQIDETDGPEQIYELAAERFRKNFS
ncbi:MAG: GNAT family N-acetyltransferase, partial [Actinobacteria bacterium]|nr:GNAT family N-acetyltransferase [Actinomycetota bacterium]